MTDHRVIAANPPAAEVRNDTAPSLADLLGLPESARLLQRIPKTILTDPWTNASPPDARLLNKLVQRAEVIGILRPQTINVPEHHGKSLNVTDIPLLEVKLTPEVKPRDLTRIAELLHRGMPRPVVALIHYDGPAAACPVLSLALTRPSRSDPTGNTSVIDHAIRVPVAEIASGALNISNYSRTDLWALYRDLVRTVATGGSAATKQLPAVDAIKLRQRLASLEAELSGVSRDAKREKNAQKRIQLNAMGKNLRQQIEAVKGSLYGESISESDQSESENE